MYKLQYNRRGYLKATLRLEQGQTKSLQVHRAVAFAFIPNPSNLEIINHKDETPQNNCVYNLEWCTTYYNNNYGSRNKKVRDRRISGGYAKAVVLYTYDGEKIKEYETAKDAAIDNQIERMSIINCCNGVSPTAKGLHFRYKGDVYQKREIGNYRFRYIVYKDGVFLFSTDNTKELSGKIGKKYGTMRGLIKYNKKSTRGLDGYTILVKSCDDTGFVIKDGVKIT